jgi:hypothetical protein
MAFLRKFSDVSCAITARLGASDAEDERALARKGSGREWDGSSAQEKCDGDGGDSKPHVRYQLSNHARQATGTNPNQVTQTRKTW